MTCRVKETPCTVCYATDKALWFTIPFKSRGFARIGCARACEVEEAIRYIRRTGRWQAVYGGAIDLTGIGARSITGPTVLAKTEPTQEQLYEVIKRFVNCAYREKLRADMPKGARPDVVAQLFAPEDE